MITVSAEILLNDNYITSIECNIPKNNISTPIENLLNTVKEGSSPFLLNASKLDGSGKLLSKVDYYIGSLCSDENGDFDEPYLITVNGVDLQTIVIYFDVYNNQYPRTIIINNKSYNCDSPVFKTFLDTTDKIDIIIDNWNTPYYPVQIQGINLAYLYFDAVQIKGVKVNQQNRQNVSAISYGLLSQIGDIELIDFDNFIYTCIKKNIINLNSICKLYIMNNGTKQLLTTLFVNKLEYSPNERIATISLQDNLEKLQDIYCDGIDYDYISPETKSLKYFYDYLELVSIKSGFKFVPLNDETENILNSTIISYVLLNSGTLWEQWDKLCQVAQLHIYKNNNNEIVVIYKV